MPIEKAKSDIETYLKTQLLELVSSPEFVELGQCTGCLFIYAATAVKYLTLLDSIMVGEQTEMLNDLISKSYEPVSSSDATSLVDDLYRQIMCDASIAATLVPDGDDEAARAVLHNLHAVLYTQNDQVFWYHSSFPDFIFSQARSNFRIDMEDFTFL